MNYLLIEFIGVFFLTLFKSLSNMCSADAKVEAIMNAIVGALTLFIFCIYSLSISKGMFNPSFAIIESLWNNMSVETTLGYITAHILASLLATSVLTLIVPFGFLSKQGVNLGVAAINTNNDEFSLFTMEVLGTFGLFFGYLYYQDASKKTNEFEGAFFYSLLAGALQMATYRSNGGAYNLAVITGGILFNGSAQYKVIFLFLGNVAGALIAKLLYEQVMVEKMVVKENKTIKKMLHK